MCQYFFGKESESSRKNNKPADYAERQQQEIYMCTGAKLVNEIIKLQSTPSGSPDWEYIEAYIKTIETKVSQTLERLANRLEVKSL